MKYQKSEFHNSLSLHKGWLSLFEATRQKRAIKARESTIRANDEQRLHLHDLRNEIYRLTEESNDPLFLFHCAAEVSPLTFSAFSLAFWTSPNLDHALQQIEDFSIVMSSPVRVEYHKNLQGNGELWIYHSEALHKESYTTYMGIALFMATLVKMIQSVANDPEMVIEVELISERFGSALLTEIEQLTQTKISVGYPVQKIRVANKYLQRVNLQHDHEVHFSMLNLLRHRAESLKKYDLILQIYNILNQRTELSHVSAETVSAALNMNLRTLNRRLAELNTSYRGVLEKYKLEKALHLLSHSNTNMTEIAFQLGFSDLSTFSRAFKRWTGFSPRSLKNNMKKSEE